MSDNRLVFEGLQELIQDLRNLPDALASEAAEVIQASTVSAGAEIAKGYPRRTGDLRTKLRTSVSRNGVSVIGTVKNTSKHAWMFENGTQARHTSLGANRGSMPPGHVFIPVMQRKRRQMYESLKAVVAKQGLDVSGDE